MSESTSHIEISNRLAVSFHQDKVTLHLGSFDGVQGWSAKINLNEKERRALYEAIRPEESN